MNHITRQRVTPVVASLALSLATIASAGCGGSSQGTTASTANASTATGAAGAAAHRSQSKATGSASEHTAAGAATTAASRVRGPVARALAGFVSCLRANGVNMPAPNTAGRGPLLDVKGIDTKSPKFVAARAKCVPQLKSALSAAKPASAPKG